MTMKTATQLPVDLITYVHLAHHALMTLSTALPIVTAVLSTVKAINASLTAMAHTILAPTLMPCQVSLASAPMVMNAHPSTVLITLASPLALAIKYQGNLMMGATALIAVSAALGCALATSARVNA
jgi:hypothetical protein